MKKLSRKKPKSWERNLLMLAVASCFTTEAAIAASPVLPNGPTVINGQVFFNYNGNLLQITNTPGAVINWQGFSIGASEITRFIQQSASSTVLNRVAAGNPSVILGALQSQLANGATAGRVYLINPSGVVFGAGAQINTGGLVVSTLGLSDADFKAGRDRFTEVQGAGGITNQGKITTPTGGSIYLIAPNIANSGIIRSDGGEIILAAGKSVELVSSSSPDIRVTITAPDNQVVNLGQIIAQGGKVGIYGGLIKQAGVVNANTAVRGENGKIVFKATKDVTLEAGSTTTASGPTAGTISIQSETGKAVVAGTVEANAAQGTGGTVAIAAPQGVTVESTGTIAANGIEGGSVSLSSTAGSVAVAGTLTANAATGRAGEVALTAATSASLASTGQVSASGGQGNGSVSIKGSESVTLDAGSKVVASGTTGGTVAVQADQGTVVAQATIDATGTDGAGGNVQIAARSDITLDDASRILAGGRSGGIVKIQSSEGTLLASGLIDGQGNHGPGGQVWLLAPRVGLVRETVVNASGTTGGGTVLVGGDYQGKNPEVQNAWRTYVGPDVVIRTDAIQNGDGGKVIVWSDDTTRFYGSITTRGGAQSGNGGFVETSGHNFLDIRGSVNTLASNGTAGMWLLDPADINIQSGAGTFTALTDVDQFADPNIAGNTIDVALINGAGSNVMLQVTHDINFGVAVNIATAGVGLTGRAGNNINLANSITTNGGFVALTANDPGGTPTGTGSIIGGGNITTTIGTANSAGGAVTLSVAAGIGSISVGTIDTRGSAGANDNAGGAGGSVNITTIDGAITTGTVNSSGGAGGPGISGTANAHAGGLAGGITLQVSAPTAARAISAGAITAIGGVGGNPGGSNPGGTGGTGGTVILSTTSGNGGAISVGAISTSGGAGGAASDNSNNGGAAGGSGAVTVTAFGAGQNVTLAGAVQTNGATGGAGGANAGKTGGDGGAAGAITVVAAGGSISFGGTLNATGGTGGTGNIAGATGAGANISLSVGAASTLNQVINAGLGSLFKGGTGSLALTQANNYSGGTTISGGTLAVSGMGTAGTGTIAVGANTLDVVNGANVTNAVTINGGTIANSAGAGTLSAGGMTLLGDSNVSSAGAGLVISAGITDGASNFGVTKLGAGTVTLSSANTYDGGTTINAGTLSISNDNQLGGVGGGIAFGGGTLLTTAGVTSARAVTLTGTGIIDEGGNSAAFSGVFSGAGGLTKNGSGTVTLTSTANNTYDGVTTINAGTLSAQHANALGSTAGGTVVASGATLEIAGVAIGAEAVTLNGIGVGGLGAITGIGTASLSGGVTLGSNSVIGGAGTLTLSGVINDGASSFGVGKAGSGTLILGGVNTYDGPTSIGGGTLQIATDSALGNAPGAFTPAQLALTGGGILKTTASFALDIKRGVQLGLGGGTFNTDPATTLAIQYDGSNAAIRGTGLLTKTGGGTLVLPAGNTYSGVTAINAGTLKIAADNSLGVAPGNQLTFDGGVLQTTATFALASTRGVTINANGGTIDVDPGQTLTYNGIIAAGTGTGGLTKIDLGTLQLGGANTYTGVTNVIGGTLQLSGGSAIADTGAVVLANTAGVVLALQSSETIGSLAGGGATGGNVALNANTLTAGGNNATTTFAGLMSGAGALTKAGTGIFTLAGANTYTGTTTINAGTLEIGSGGTTGSIASANLVDNGTLSFNRSDAVSYNGVISSTGGVTVNGGGTLTLGSANTYSGATTVNGASTLKLGIANAIGSSSAVTLNATSTLDLNGFSDAIGSLAGGGGTKVTSGVGGAAALTTGADNASTTYSGVIQNGSGTVGLTKIGSGTFTLGAVNTYNGATVVNGSGTLQVGILNALPGNSAVSLGGTATLDLNGFNAAIGSLAGVAGTKVTTGVAGAVTLTAGGDNSSTTFGGVLQDGSGQLLLTKAGTGILTLSGANTYGGVTDVAVGTLRANNASALGTTAGATTVASGATLDIAGVAIGTENLTLDGNGVGSNGALTSSGVASLAGAITIANPARIGGGGTLTLSGAVTGAALDLANTGGGTTFSNNVTLPSLTTAGNNFNVAFTGANTSIAGTTTFANIGTLTLGALSTDTLAFTGGVIATAPSSKNIAGTITAAGAGVINLGITPVSVTDNALVGGASTGLITLGNATLADGKSLTVGTGIANAINLGSVVGNVGAGTEMLTINTTGAVNVTGAVGAGGNKLDQVTIIQSNGTTFAASVDARNVTLGDTAAGQTIAFQGNTNVSAGMSIGTGTGAYNVGFTGVNNTIAGNTVFNNSGTVTLGNAASNTTFTGGVDTSIAPSLTNIGGTLATTGTLMKLGMTTLIADSTLNSGGGNVTFTGTINADLAALNRKLAINAGAGTVTFPGNVGVTQTLADFDVTGASVLFNAGAPQTVSVKAQGGNTATITGAVTLAQNLTVDTSGATPNNLTFSTGASTINAAAAGVQGLTLDAGAGRIDLQGVVGTSALADLTVSSAATARFGNNVTTTGPQNVNAGTIQTNGTHTTAGNNIVLNGNLTLQSNTVLNTGGGAISVTGTTDGGFALIANSSGATTFTGAVGGSVPLAALTTDVGGATNINGGLVKTTGSQTYGDAVTLGAPTTFNATSPAATIAFNKAGLALDAQANALVISADEIDFGGGANSIRGTSTIQLQPNNPNAAIWLGTAADVPQGPHANELDLTTADLAALTAGFTGVGPARPITIGHNAGTHTITIGNATFNDSVLIQAPVGAGNIAWYLGGGTPILNAPNVDFNVPGLINGGGTVNAAPTGTLTIIQSGGIGTLAVPLQTNVTNLTAANSGSGDLNINNAGSVNIVGQLSNSVPGGEVRLSTTNGSINTGTAAVTSNNGRIALIANDTGVAGGANITVGAGGTFCSNFNGVICTGAAGGPITLYAADNVTTNGAVRSGGGLVTVIAGTASGINGADPSFTGLNPRKPTETTQDNNGLIFINAPLDAGAGAAILISATTNSANTISGITQGANGAITTGNLTAITLHGLGGQGGGGASIDLSTAVPPNTSGSISLFACAEKGCPDPGSTPAKPFNTAPMIVNIGSLNPVIPLTDPSNRNYSDGALTYIDTGSATVSGVGTVNVSGVGTVNDFTFFTPGNVNITGPGIAARNLTVQAQGSITFVGFTGLPNSSINSGNPGGSLNFVAGSVVPGSGFIDYSPLGGGAIGSATAPFNHSLTFTATGNVILAGGIYMGAGTNFAVKANNAVSMNNGAVTPGASGTGDIVLAGNYDVHTLGDASFTGRNFTICGLGGGALPVCSAAGNNQVAAGENLVAGGNVNFNLSGDIDVTAGVSNGTSSSAASISAADINIGGTARNITLTGGSNSSATMSGTNVFIGSTDARANSILLKAGTSLVNGATPQEQHADAKINATDYLSTYLGAGGLTMVGGAASVMASATATAQATAIATLKAGDITLDVANVGNVLMQGGTSVAQTGLSASKLDLSTDAGVSIASSNSFSPFISGSFTMLGGSATAGPAAAHAAAAAIIDGGTNLKMQIGTGLTLTAGTAVATGNVGSCAGAGGACTNVSALLSSKSGKDITVSTGNVNFTGGSVSANGTGATATGFAGADAGSVGGTLVTLATINASLGRLTFTGGLQSGNGLMNSDASFLSVGGIKISGNPGGGFPALTLNGAAGTGLFQNVLSSGTIISLDGSGPPVQIVGGVSICPVLTAACSGGAYGTAFVLSGAPPSNLDPLLADLFSSIEQGKTNRIALFLNDNQGTRKSGDKNYCK